MPSESVERALESCYDAVAYPELWTEALNDLAAALGASAAMFFPKDAKEDAAAAPASVAYKEFLEDFVAGGWYDGHYRSERGWSLIERGVKTVVIEHDLATDEERKKLPHYNELYLRWGYPGFAAVGFEGEAGDSWCLPLIRNRREGFFTHGEAEDMAFLRPHLSRMVRMSALAGKSRSDGALETFEALGQAVLAVDFQGRVTGVNGSAEALLARNARYLGLRHGRLRASGRGDDARLQALVGASADWSVPVSDLRKALPVYIARNGLPPISVEAISPPGLVRSLSGSAHAFLLVKEIEAALPADPDRLQAALGLTRSEAILCSRLMNGESVAEVAEGMGTALGTARQRLKVVLQKTGTRRQGELLLLLSRI